MPKLAHWIMQYLLAVVSMFGLLAVVDLTMRGATWESAWPPALLWAVLASAFFIGTRYRNMQRARAARDPCARQ